MKKNSQNSYGSIIDIEQYELAGNERSVIDELDEEIADHYLSNLKYGLEGTDGTRWSNFVAYMKNHHPSASIFLASKRNPYTRINKALVFWNSVSLMFLYSCIFPHAMSSLPVAILITLLMMPYSTLLDALATCRYARRQKRCLAWLRKAGSCFLFILSVIAISYISTGIIVLKLEERPVGKTVIIFCISVALSQLLPCVLGLANWYLISWTGVLCCPQCRCSISGHSVGNEGYVCCPILDLCPVRFVLNMYTLGESTYYEDKKRFEEQYPDRIAIDRFSYKEYESGLLMESNGQSGYFDPEAHSETL